MLQLIAPEHYGEFIDDLAEMQRLRYRVFKQRLDWDVQVSGDMEVDEFDVLRPVHLLHRSTDGQIQGCVRLLRVHGTNHASRHFSNSSGGAAGTTKRSRVGKQPIRS